MYGRSAVVDIRLLIDGENNLGERPLWDAAEQKLYWTDVPTARSFASTPMAATSRSGR
jgi:sugar lactone lactonase YvrE